MGVEGNVAVVPAPVADLASTELPEEDERLARPGCYVEHEGGVLAAVRQILDAASTYSSRTRASTPTRIRWPRARPIGTA